MSTLRDLLSDLQTTLQADARLAGVNVYAHGGDFGLEDLQEYARNSPCVVLAILGFESQIEAGHFMAEVSWGMACLTRDTPDAGASDLDGARHVTVLALADRATRAVLAAFSGGGPLVGRPQGFAVVNEYSRELDDEGAALFAAAWSQPVELEDVVIADLDDLITVATDIETYTRPTEAVGEVPEIQALNTALDE